MNIGIMSDLKDDYPFTLKQVQADACKKYLRTLYKRHRINFGDMHIVTPNQDENDPVKYHVATRKLSDYILNASVRPLSLNFLDGLIGGGKTSIEEHLRGTENVAVVVEDLDQFGQILKASIPGTLARKIREDAMARINFTVLMFSLRDHPDNLYIVERNLFYSDWIFSADITYADNVTDKDFEDAILYGKPLKPTHISIPSCPSYVFGFILSLPKSIGYTYLADTDASESYKRMIARGEEHDKLWDFRSLKKMADKFAALYYMPFCYAYAEPRYLLNANHEPVFPKKNYTEKVSFKTPEVEVPNAEESFDKVSGELPTFANTEEEESYKKLFGSS